MRCGNRERGQTVSGGPENSKPSSYKYSVTQNRLRFYDAPDKGCITDAADFVVKDDAIWVDRPQPYQGFVHGRYIYPATGKVTEGWLEADGLKNELKRPLQKRNGLHL